VASCPPSNVTIASNVLSTTGDIYASNGTFTGNLTVAGNILGPVTFANLYVANSITTTNVYFQNRILSTNLPTLSSAQGTWGSSANVARVTVDQYGRVSAVSNAIITTSPAAVPVVQVTSSYSAQVTDYYIGVNGTGVTVTLPLGSSTYVGKTYVVKDESGEITPNSTYRFMVVTSGSDRIDGSASLTVTVSFISLTFLWTGTVWSII
jgi:hypothetical protein